MRAGVGIYMFFININYMYARKTVPERKEYL